LVGLHPGRLQPATVGQAVNNILAVAFNHIANVGKENIANIVDATESRIINGIAYAALIQEARTSLPTGQEISKYFWKKQSPTD
jgi:uncharacterized protein (DUF2342 family)